MHSLNSLMVLVSDCSINSSEKINLLHPLREMGPKFISTVTGVNGVTDKLKDFPRSHPALVGENMWPFAGNLVHLGMVF